MIFRNATLYKIALRGAMRGWRGRDLPLPSMCMIFALGDLDGWNALDEIINVGRHQDGAFRGFVDLSSEPIYKRKDAR